MYGWMDMKKIEGWLDLYKNGWLDGKEKKLMDG